MSRDLVRQRDHGILRLYGRTLLIVSNLTSLVAIGIVVFLIYQVTSPDHILRGLCDLMGGSFRSNISHHLAKVGGNRTGGAAI